MRSISLQIPLAKTDIGHAEHEAVARVMASGRLARGAEIAAFEREFAAWHGVRAAAMANSGTSALTCVLRALGVAAGDEVIIPALTFVATANAVLNCGAVPVLVDVLPATGNIDPGLLRRAVSPRTKAVVPVHLFGAAAAMDAILAAAHEFGLAVVEDAAEALGSRSGTRPAGARGDAGIFGFYPNKVLTTAEGGMAISDDEDLIARCAELANQGSNRTGYGMSARGNELSAALGRAQLATLEVRLAARRALAARLQEQLAARTGLTMLGYDGSERSWFTCPVVLPADSDRNAVRAALADARIETAAYFPAVHDIDGYRDIVHVPGPLPTSEDLGARLIALPFWPGMEPHVGTVCEQLARALDR